MKMLSLVLFLILSLSTISFAASNNTEVLTISTYYPAPHGVYKQLRTSELVVGSSGSPSDFATFPGSIRLKPVENPPGPPAASSQPIGTIYFDNTTKNLMYYNGTGSWQPLGSGGSTGGGSLINSVHTQNDCTSAGGTVTNIGVAFPLCLFNMANCPTTGSWKQYENWSTTVSKTGSVSLAAVICGANSCGACGPSTTTAPGHAWANTAQEQRQYISYAGDFPSDCCQLTSGAPTLPMFGCVTTTTGQKHSRQSGAPLYATRTQIGCY